MRFLKELQLSKTAAIARYLYLISGFLLVGIGVLGAFLPLLPTTIFLILASACFMKSSPRANEWLINNKFLGSYLRNYQYKTGMTITSKIVHTVILWTSILITVIVFTADPAVRILLLLIAVGVTLHLYTVKTAGRSDRQIKCGSRTHRPAKTDPEHQQ